MDVNPFATTGFRGVDLTPAFSLLSFGLIHERDAMVDNDEFTIVLQI